MDKRKLQKLKRLTKKIAELTEERKLLKIELAKNCTHPEEFVCKYTWHHGYGKYVEGLQCTLCQARKGFKGQGYWQSFEEYINTDRGYSWTD